jgi:hypothetical protein
MILEKSLSIFALLLPWAIFIANVRFFRGEHKIVSALASVMLVYIVLILQVHLIDARLETELYAFDLNGDGVFTGAEIVPAQEAAMADWANDTARAMAPITGAIFSALYTLISFTICFLGSWLWSKLRAKTTRDGSQ